MATMTVTEARASLPEVLDRVLEGEEVTITRHGKPVAVVVRPEAIRARRAHRAFEAADRLAERLERARTEPLSQRGVIPTEVAEQMIAEIRADRDAR